MAMSQSMPRTVSQDSTDGIRKRVCKACDRCRLKKSKCDGAHPCSRCKADNAICVFGERKKSHDKVYPKGYVEMLEQQQSQLVSGLQEMYKRLSIANAWTSATLSETNGHPLTHDILAALDLLEAKQDGSGDLESFEEDCQKLQDRLLSEGSGYVQRRGSFSSDSDNSQRPQHSRNVSHSTPAMAQPPVFRDNFSFGSPTSSPTVQSPTQMKATHRPSLSFAVQPPTALHLPHQNHFLSQSAHHTHSPLSNDPQLYQPDWAIPDMSTPEQVLRTKLALQTSGLMQHHQSQQQQRQQSSPVHSNLHNAHRSALLLHHHHQHHQQQAQASLQQQTNQSQAHAAHVLSQQQQLHLHRQQQAAMFEPTAFDSGMSSNFVDTFPADMHMSGFGPGLLQNGAVDFSMDPMEMEFNKFISVTT